MMPSLSLENLVSLSLQIALLILGSALLFKLLRLRDPAVRLGCFQLILLLCLCLPLVQPWKASRLPHYVWAPATMVPVAAVRPETASQVARDWPSFSATQIVSFVLVVGIVVRVLWILIGLTSLHRYRSTSRPGVQLPPAVREFMTRRGIEAQFAISEKLGGPVTFGLRRPLVLLPGQFEVMAPATREAVLCHELVHVLRKDWLFAVAEEFVLAALWFHPAVWWVVFEIRLAREQTVDLEVIRTAGSRNMYLEALLEAAKATRPDRILATTSFLWRGHLVRRVTAIVGAASISKRRLISSLGAALVGTLLLVRISFALFPTSSETHAQQASIVPVQIERGGDHLLFRASIEYPRWVIEKQVAGLIVTEVTTDERGLVTDAHVISGPQELRRVVLQSVLNWQFDPQSQPPGPVEIAIRFHLPAPSQPGSVVLPEHSVRSESKAREGRPSFLDSSADESEAIARMIINTTLAKEGRLTGKIMAIRTHGAAERSDLQLPIHIGDAITGESIQVLEEFLQSIDKRFLVGLETSPNGFISLLC